MEPNHKWPTNGQKVNVKDWPKCCYYLFLYLNNWEFPNGQCCHLVCNASRDLWWSTCVDDWHGDEFPPLLISGKFHNWSAMPSTMRKSRQPGRKPTPSTLTLYELDLSEKAKKNIFAFFCSSSNTEVTNDVEIHKDHFVYVPSQSEMMLQCNVVSHWLGAYTKWSLNPSLWKSRDYLF